MRTRSLLVPAAALALVLSAAACGDDDDAADTTTTTATTEAPAESSTTTEAEESTETTEAPATDDLTGLLVTPEDLGEGFTEGEYETSTEVGPCGQEFDDPYESVVGAVLVNEELELALQHELQSYADEDTAATVLADAQEALSCGADTTTEGVVLGEPSDVSEDVGAPAFALELTNETEGIEGGLVAVQVGAVLSIYQFQGPVGVEEGPNPQDVVTANVEALMAELG